MHQGNEREETKEKKIVFFTQKIKQMLTFLVFYHSYSIYNAHKKKL